MRVFRATRRLGKVETRRVAYGTGRGVHAIGRTTYLCWQRRYWRGETETPDGAPDMIWQLFLYLAPGHLPPRCTVSVFILALIVICFRFGFCLSNGYDDVRIAARLLEEFDSI
jgi:hypothetical protein